MNPDRTSDDYLGAPGFQSVLVECLEKLERGESLNSEQLLQSHPEYATQLGAFLADQKRLVRIATQVRDSLAGKPRPEVPASQLDETIDSNPKSSGVARGDHIRYIGEYEVLEEIARGGMGVVFKARQQSLNRVVALKMILSGRLADAADVERFHREARAAGRLKHPNIVPIHEIGEHDGHHYFTMDYIEGHTLSEEIRDETVAARRAAELVMRAARAVEFAHQQGTLHRDLKPANLLIDLDHQPQITDFGLAKFVGDDHSREELTASGQILGTPSYMSPEQAAGKQSHIGPATDIYSLGAILYACLTGRAPFVADTAVDTLLQVIRNEPIAPRTLNSTVPRDLETICLKCLAKEPHRRYGTAQLLADDLERFLQGRTVTARPVGPIAKTWRWCKRKPVAAALCATSLLLLLALAIGAPLIAVQQKRIADQTIDFARQQKRIAEQQTRIADQQTEFANQQQAFAEDEHDLRLAAEAARGREQRERNRVEHLLYASHLKSAQREWRLRDYDAAFNLLDACQRDLRGWEHDFLYTRFTDQLGTIMGHNGPVKAVAYSPDGRRVVVGGGAGPAFRYRSELKIWNVETLELEHQLEGHKRPITCVAFSPDGELVLSGSEDKALRLWRVAGGATVHLLAGHAREVTAAAFDPAGRLVASGSKDQSVMLWDASTGDRMKTLEGHTKPITSLAFSPDGKQLVSGAGDPESVGSNGELRAWDVATGELLWESASIAGAVTCVDYHPDGKQLVCGGGESGRPPRGEGRFGALTIRDAATGAEQLQLAGHHGVLRSAVFSPSGARIASAAADQKLVLWDAKTGAPAVTLTGQTAHDATSLRFSPDGSQLAIGAHAALALAGEVRLWRLQPADDRVVQGLGNLLNGAVVGPDGRRAAVVFNDADEELVVWDLRANRAVATLRGHGAAVTAVAFGPRGDRLVTGSQDQTVRVWDVASGRQLQELAGHTTAVLCVAFAADGRRIASGGGEVGVLGGPSPNSAGNRPGELRVWDAQTGKQLWNLQGHAGAVMSTTFSPDGDWVVSGGLGGSFLAQGEVCVWNVATGERAHRINGPPMAVLSVAVSPDSRQFALGGGMGPGPHKIDVRALGTGESIRTLPGHRGTVFSIDYSPDGDRIVTAGLKGNPPDATSTLKVWSAETGVELLEISSSARRLGNAMFLPGGEGILASGTEDGGSYLSLWKATRRQAASLTIRQGLATAASSVVFSPDGKLLASGGHDKTVHLWDTTTGVELRGLMQHADAVQDVDFSPAGEQLVCASGNDVYLWEIKQAEKQPIVLHGHRRTVHGVAFSRDGERVVSGSADGTLRIWNARTGGEFRTISGAKAAVRGVAFAADDQRVVGACADHKVRAWDVATGEQVFSAEGHKELVSCVAASPQGDTLATGSFDDTLKIWDAETGAAVATLTGHASSVLSVAFSADGKRLVSGSADRTVKIWDVETREVLQTLHGHQFFVRSVAAGPLGHYFASAAGIEDMTIRIWAQPERTRSVEDNSEQ